jgi:hypothetical protein
MIDRDPFDDRLQQHRFPSTRWCHDERTLPISNRRNEIDRAPRELRPTFRRLPRLERELPIRIRRNERLKVRPPQRIRRIIAIHRNNVSRYDTIPLIASVRHRDHVTASQSILSNQRRRHQRIIRIGEITIARVTYESHVALYIEPPRGFAFDHHRPDRTARPIVVMPMPPIPAPTVIPVILVELVILIVLMMLLAGRIRLLLSLILLLPLAALLLIVPVPMPEAAIPSTPLKISPIVERLVPTTALLVATIVLAIAPVAPLRRLLIRRWC